MLIQNYRDSNSRNPEKIEEKSLFVIIFSFQISILSKRKENKKMEFFKCMSADLRILAKLIDNDEIDEEELKYQLQLLIDELEPENDEYKA